MQEEGKGKKWKRRGRGGEVDCCRKPHPQCPQVKAEGRRGGDAQGPCRVRADRDDADLKGRIIQSAHTPDTPTEQRRQPPAAQRRGDYQR